mmetsp:Transcript_90578/g.256049  ORF Transcript_90578/g.256049 Transcript_90578/m.256049 type:complete len:87 (+) Transcript_90578:3-263(+)
MPASNKTPPVIIASQLPEAAPQLSRQGTAAAAAAALDGLGVVGGGGGVTARTLRRLQEVQQYELPRGHARLAHRHRYDITGWKSKG